MSVSRFIADQRTSYPVPHAVSCRILGVSQSWFYQWLRRPITAGRVRRGVGQGGGRHVHRVAADVRVAADPRRSGSGGVVGGCEYGRRFDAPAGSAGPQTQAQQRVDPAGPESTAVPGSGEAGLHRGRAVALYIYGRDGSMAHVNEPARMITRAGAERRVADRASRRPVFALFAVAAGLVIGAVAGVVADAEPLTYTVISQVQTGNGPVLAVAVDTYSVGDARTIGLDLYTDNPDGFGLQVFCSDAPGVLVATAQVSDSGIATENDLSSC